MPPLHAVLRTAVDALTDAGVYRPEEDARSLVSHVLGLRDLEELRPTDDLAAHEASAFDALVARRAERVPLPHLTGLVAFRGIHLEVGRGVFVPQPETASVVGWAVAALAADNGPAPTVADLCTGAGTIAFALANEVPRATVHAVEREPGALAWARRNAAARVTAGDPPVHLHLGDVEGCLPEFDGTLDLVASNPPYVATGEAHLPDPEVVGHDPATALWAGDDGLDVVRLVERAARRLLRPGGLVVIEHSDRQGGGAPALLTAAGGWTEVSDHVDHDGRDRFITARWTGHRSPQVRV
jgi:release factor glutamine methyltransferase